MKTTLYLVRHAQPKSHLQGGGLTDTGKSQARKVASRLRKEISGKHLLGRKPLLVVSPTLRTRQTASPITKSLHLHPLKHSAFSEKYLVDTNKSFVSPTFLMHHVATSRIWRAFKHIFRSNLGRTIIIVTHGNVIRALRAKLEHRTYGYMSKLTVSCASITKIELEDSDNFDVKSTQYWEI